MLINHQNKLERAFSLIELAAVVTIISLLVGGVIAGQSLYRSSELKSNGFDAQRYVAAAINFRTQYKYFAGDMPNATNYWGIAGGSTGTDAACYTAASTGPATCNGDGNGQVDLATSATGPFEAFRFWQQLAAAGFISGSFTGTLGAGGMNDGVLSGNVLGGNVPASKSTGIGFGFYFLNPIATNYTLTYRNALFMGARTAGSNPIGAAYTPKDAANLDVKMDDGKPATGNWIASLTGGNAFGDASACVNSATAADFSPTTNAYKLSIATKVCSFIILSGY